MSKQLDNADLIRMRLLTAPVAGEIPTTLDLTKLDVIVDRQKQIEAEVAKGVAKSTGTAITILWEGFVTVDKNARRPRLAHSYTLVVWSKPVIAGKNLTADDVMESVVQRLWQWRPVGGHAFSECEVKDGGLVPDAKYLKYDVQVVIPISH
jgi:hypothetical protein